MTKDINVKPLQKVSERVIDQLKSQDLRFHACDNVADFLNDEDRLGLINELEPHFEAILRALIIDVDNDPNSQGTARRLSKMYVNELMRGRFYPAPEATAFPNIESHHTDKYEGMLVVRSEIRSVCSHHHQPVSGTCYIGILPSDKVIGLSKYTRIAQHCARRGTLQEELCQHILRNIKLATDCRDVGVYIEASHGCCENRGIMAHSSLTQTTAVSGQFFSDTVKKEFMDNIILQKMNHRSS